MVDLTLLGANIQMQRKLLKLTQQELATKANISKVYLQQVESGKANLSFKMFNSICEALELKTDFKLEPKKQEGKELKTNKEYIADHERDKNELIVKREQLKFEIFDIDAELAEINKFIEELQEEN